VDPFQTHYFSENLVAAGIEPGTSGSVARNSDHWTTEAVYKLTSNIFFLVSLGGVRLSPLGMLATNWPIVPGPDDRRW
jgi:hypothetical protein